METLYNGIRLPELWPPRRTLDADRKLLPVPYLAAPPELIPIDVGRQLFVDDFLVADSTLIPVYHQAVKYEGNPVLRPETALEHGEGLAVPGAAPKSGGVWFDERDRLFKMWYEAGWLHSMAYAESADGVRWERPAISPDGTNRLLPGIRPDSTSVVLDPTGGDARWKLFLRMPGGMMPGMVTTSADGIRWAPPVYTGAMLDRSTMFYNPFRKKWVYSIRSVFSGRSRDYFECADPVAEAAFRPDDPVQWLRTDERDLPAEDIGMTPQLYNVDAVAYESILLGLFEIHMGPENEECACRGIPKRTELQPMYSRDGFHFSRPSRTPLIAASRRAGTWDRGYVQSVGGCCLTVGDELWIYYIGFAGDESNLSPYWGCTGMYANSATGIAKMRRDGFVSLRGGKGGGSLTTRPVLFSGSRFFVNAVGTVRAEALDAEGRVIEPFTLENCRDFAGDSTRAEITWAGGDLSRLAGTATRFRFTLGRASDLYAFWVSATPDGESGGFHGAGLVRN